MFALDDKYFILQTKAEQRWRREAFFSVWGGQRGHHISDPSSHREDVLTRGQGVRSRFHFSNQLNFYAF